MERANCDPELGTSTGHRDLGMSTHSLFASFLPQQLRQQEAAAAEAEEKEEMEIMEGEHAARRRGSVAGKGGARTPFGAYCGSSAKPGAQGMLHFPM